MESQLVKMEEESDAESCFSSDFETQTVTQKGASSKKFSPVVLASLNALFENGMVGVGERYLSAIERAAQDTKLSPNQIKVSLSTNDIFITVHSILHVTPSVIFGFIINSSEEALHT